MGEQWIHFTGTMRKGGTPKRGTSFFPLLYNAKEATLGPLWELEKISAMINTMAKLHKIFSKHLCHFLKVVFLEAAVPSPLFVNPLLSVPLSQKFPTPMPFPSDNNLAVSVLRTLACRNQVGSDVSWVYWKRRWKLWPTE